MLGGQRHAHAAALERLGIDVWVRRRPAAAGKASRQEDAGAAAAQALGASSITGRARSAGDVKATARQAPTTGRIATPAPARQHPPAPAPPRPAPSTPAVATVAPVAPFRIRCFHYGDVFAAIAEDAWPHRRFVFDVALALNRFQPGERNVLDFAWPLPGAAPDGAERAFRAFFGHQTRNAPRTLIAGGRVAELLGATPPTECAVLNGHLYIPPLRLDAAAKMALWALMQKHRPAPP